MKTQRELILHYWGTIHDMCSAYNEKHGTDVKPWECVNCGGPFYSHPKFDAPAEGYEFAVAILEGRPVFVGDALYNGYGAYLRVTENCGFIFENMSWTPPAPKRTFTLNGVELPCPEKNIDTREQYSLGINTGSIYWFATRGDRDVVSEVLDRILTQARDS